MTGLTVANALVLVAAATWLASLTLPSRQAVRVRNAFLLRRGRLTDLGWTPSNTPGDFRAETAQPPAEIAAAVAAAGVCDAGGDWDRALALVGMLVRHSQREGAIQADLATTYNGIVAGSGYCADYVRVYLAAARAVDVFCRQWAFSFDGFGGHGHTFVEVYDRTSASWRFVDVHNNVYATLADRQTPLDALSLRDALLANPSSIAFRRAAPGRLGFPHSEKLLAYYRRGARQWYVWWGNDVITRERAASLKAIARVSGRFAHRIGSVLGHLPSLVVLATADNERDIERMEALRRRVLGALSVCGVLAALLALQFGWSYYVRRSA